MSAKPRAELPPKLTAAPKKKIGFWGWVGIVFVVLLGFIVWHAILVNSDLSQGPESTTNSVTVEPKPQDKSPETNRPIDLSQSFEPNFLLSVQDRLKQSVSDVNFIAELKQKAEQGLANAQSILGLCSLRGQGVPRDSNEAVKWLTKAAEQGNAVGQALLGVYYEHEAKSHYDGRGIERDYKQAIYWYRKAAEQGDVAAQCSLGDCYYKGIGVEQDYKEAVKWYTKAAVGGFDRAQCISV